MPVLCLVAAIVISLALYLRLFAGRVEEMSSPDGNKIAGYRIYDFFPATDAAQSAVQRRTKLTPFRHTVLAGATYGADITIA
ncbi:MAG TPA: hypothetical protein VMT53_03535 [Terriglobales bacterium]|nr:hypothetical protein [Terriglobales bacterium]